MPQKRKNPLELLAQAAVGPKPPAPTKKSATLAPLPTYRSVDVYVPVKRIRCDTPPIKAAQSQYIQVSEKGTKFYIELSNRDFLAELRAYLDETGVAAFYGADIPEIQKGIRSGSEPDDVVFLGWKPKDALRPHALGTKVVKAKRVLHSVTVV
tara:strand:- start:341 stop:799 length:459 start_codon:yes stop_codon:yes gene_type:complete